MLLTVQSGCYPVETMDAMARCGHNVDMQRLSCRLTSNPLKRTSVSRSQSSPDWLPGIQKVQAGESQWRRPALPSNFVLL